MPNDERTSRFRGSMARAACVLLTLLSLVVAARAAADDFADDLKARRARVMDRLGPDSILLMWSAPVQRYSLDVDYEYRQDSNLYYLTGIAQPDTLLVLMPGNTAHREILFIKEANPRQDPWSGPGLTSNDAKARTGIDTVLATNQFEPFVAAVLSQSGTGSIAARDMTAYFQALEAGRARIALALQANRSVDDPLTPPLEFARKLRDRFTGFQTFDVTPILSDLRTVKTAYERKVLAKSVDISSEAQMAGMRAARPGAYEYEVKAAIEAVHRGRGALSWAYPSIVGSGPNATILHYSDSGRRMEAGDLLLADAACNYDYMAADITRTYPITGQFSNVQKDIYAVVLQAQDEAMRVARPGASLVDVHNKTVEIVKAGLLRLGLITDSNSEQYRVWYMHGATHYIGIDVHDVGSQRRPLAPGMAFVIEPGIYIRPGALDALPRTPENAAFIDKVQPAVRKYAGIGIRIEDSFLLEESRLRRLSTGLPRTIEEIETFMRGRTAASESTR